MNLRFANPGPGDLICELDLPSTTGEPLKAEKLVGRPFVILLYPSEKVEAAEKQLLAFSESHEEFAKRGVPVIGVSMSKSDVQQAFASEKNLKFPLLSDETLRVGTSLGSLRPQKEVPADLPKGQIQLSAIRRTLLVRPSLAIARTYEDPDPQTHVAQLLQEIDSLFPAEPARRVNMHAPVLLVPDVLPESLCKQLIAVWHEKGNTDSGFMRQVDGKTVGMYDYGHKIRRDHFMKPSPELDAVKRCISTHVLPAMKMAFNYDVTRFEDFRIASYDSSRGGYFRAHRDNTTEGTAHRRFAMSLLLNNDYDGGTLRFPEYGLNEYRPGTGSAVVFSCSLLHEATDVTAGNRFVLLTFFYGEAEAVKRDEYNRRTGGTYRA